MTEKQNIRFFSLIRSALWNQDPDFNLFSDISEAEWVELYHVASKQALLGIVFDGVGRLPDGLQPEKLLKIKWFMQVEKIKISNMHISSVLYKLADIFEKEGIDVLLMKGHSVGAFYPDPQKRQPGDIDLYIPDKNQYLKTISVFEKLLGIKIDKKVKHADFKLEGVQVEIHPDLAVLQNPFRNRILQEYIAKSLINRESKLTLKDKSIDMIPSELNMFYVMFHALSHFFTSGIGLRQIIDWTMLIDKNHKSCNKENLTTFLQNAGMTKAIDAFSYIIINYLGIEDTKLPFTYQENKDLGEILINDILRGGNFGYHADDFNRPKNVVSRKINTAGMMISRSFKYYKFSPSETKWYPLRYSYESVKVILGLKN